MTQREIATWVLGIALATLLVLTGVLSHAAHAAHRPSKSPVVITFDGGGSLAEYIERYAAYRKAGRKVIIDGPCMSACTMAVGLLPEGSVCTTQFGRLAFHSAMEVRGDDRRFSLNGTRLLWTLYPEKVRALLRSKGWDAYGETAEHPDFIFIEGDELRALVHPCA